LQDTPKFTQIVIFGLKICHLATLLERKQSSGKLTFSLPLQNNFTAKEKENTFCVTEVVNLTLKR
jgi:hypothetical protein